MDSAPILQEQKFMLKPWMKLEGGQGEDSHVLINTHSGVISSCNETAWLLLLELQKGANLSLLTDVLQASYALSATEARRDSLSFLHLLRAQGCIDEDA